MYHIFFIHSSVNAHVGLLLCFGYCKQYCNENWGACFFSDHAFSFGAFLNQNNDYRTELVKTKFPIFLSSFSLFFPFKAYKVNVYVSTQTYS